MSKKYTGFIALLEEYYTIYLPSSKGLSVNTINSYKYCFQLLLTFMQEKKNKQADKVAFSDLGYNTLMTVVLRSATILPSAASNPSS